MDARTTFDTLLEKNLIPDFCSDPSRNMAPSSFVPRSNIVCERDAADFIRAWNEGLPVHQGRGQYLIGEGRVREQFFWSGPKSAERRKFTLWLEPIITVAAISRLHFDHGWPTTHLAAQSVDWAFDVVAMRNDKSETIAGEVKKTRKEIDDLLDLMTRFGKEPHSSAPQNGKARNAFKKVSSLRLSRAPVLWLVGPGGYERVFDISYSEDTIINFTTTSTEALSFSSGRN